MSGAERGILMAAFPMPPAVEHASVAAYPGALWLVRPRCVRRRVHRRKDSPCPGSIFGSPRFQRKRSAQEWIRPRAEHRARFLHARARIDAEQCLLLVVWMSA